MNANTPNAKWDLATLVDSTLMSFDAGDKKNGSLYLCDPGNASAADPLIAKLRAAGLWSAEPAKQVPAEHKPAYKTQMQFVEALEVSVEGKTLVLLRCDHPKYPSDAGRWQAWKQAVA